MCFIQCCCSDNPKFYVTLGCIFTVAEGITVGIICGFYQASGLGVVVAQAGILTISIFVGLTIFTFQSKIKFYKLAGIVFGALIALCVWALLIPIFGGYKHYYWLSLVFAIILCICILIDTSRIIERSKYFTKWQPPTWMESFYYAFQLYFDIVTLFRELLYLLARIY